MNVYYLLVKFEYSDGQTNNERWGPYTTREEAVRSKDAGEALANVADIILISEPA